MIFSQRIGKTPVSKEMQLETMDEDLKNSLWNIYDLFILQKISDDHSYEFDITPSTFFANSMWHSFFKKPIDQIPSSYYAIKNQVRQYFFSYEWYKVYDLIEFTIGLGKHRILKGIDKEKLYEIYNNIFEREFAGYRFIDETLSPITNSIEIEELKESFSLTNNFTSLKGCNTHLKSALDKLSDKINPDYRNSIKESISAVESVAKIISNNSKDSLGGALDKIKGKLKLHSTLEKGLKQIYSYTSDADGIRHALKDEPNCDFEDAKYMLVSCSAFVNYLIAKAAKAEIKIS